MNPRCDAVARVRIYLLNEKGGKPVEETEIVADPEADAPANLMYGGMDGVCLNCPHLGEAGHCRFAGGCDY